MYKNMLRKGILSAALLIATIGQGEESPAKYPTPTPSCGIHLCNGYDLYLTASFTYWEALQDNMNLGLVSNPTAPLDLVNGEDIAMDFGYKPGFKIRAGLQFDYDNWETLFTYTWFRSKTRTSVHLDPNNTTKNLLPSWEIPNFLNPFYHEGKESWTVRMDLFDWVLARSNSIGKALCLNYFTGLRAALIRQHLAAHYTNVNPAYLLLWPSTIVRQKTSSWGIGPEIGITSKWDVGKGLYLQAQGMVDLLFTQYDLKKTERTDETVANRYHMESKSLDCLRTHTELTLGLGWGTALYTNRYHIDLLAEYGFQVFYDQNMFIDTASTQMAGKNRYPSGNLYLHGLTLTARFDF